MLKKFLFTAVVSASVFAAKDSIVAPKPKVETEVAGPAAGPGQPYIASVDTYGSLRITEANLKSTLGSELNTWFKKGLASDPSAMELEAKILSRIKKRFGVPYAEWSIIQYAEPTGLALHLTLDVVEAKDLPRRMPFLPEPKESFVDPGGILAQWAEYETTAFALVEAGKIEPETEKCAAMHCPFGHKHEKLKKWEKVFLDGAKKNGPALLEILKRDGSPEHRAAACFVLAYWVDQKKKVVDALLDRIKDPEPLVRNNAIRVLGDIAESHQDVIVPLAPLLPVLDYPRVSDRSKALYAVHVLTQRADVRQELLATQVPVLLRLMQSKQPDHSEIAHNILKKISGKDFPETDLNAWLAWGSQASPREVTKKP